MKVTELSRDQLTELKIDWLTNDMLEKYNDTPSYAMIADIDELVPDATIFQYYKRYSFSDDDFGCSSGSNAMFSPS